LDVEIDVIPEFGFEELLKLVTAVVPLEGLLLYHGLVVAKLRQGRIASARRWGTL